MNARRSDIFHLLIFATRFRLLKLLCVVLNSWNSWNSQITSTPKGGFSALSNNPGLKDLQAEILGQNPSWHIGKSESALWTPSWPWYHRKALGKPVLAVCHTLDFRQLTWLPRSPQSHVSEHVSDFRSWGLFRIRGRSGDPLSNDYRHDEKRLVHDFVPYSNTHNHIIPCLLGWYAPLHSQLAGQSSTCSVEFDIGHQLGGEVCRVIGASNLQDLDLLLVPDLLHPSCSDVNVLHLRSSTIIPSETNSVIIAAFIFASTNTGNILSRCSPSSSAKYCVCSPLWMEVDSALDFASAEEVAMQSCLVEHQSTGMPL